MVKRELIDPRTRTRFEPQEDWIVVEEAHRREVKGLSIVTPAGMKADREDTSRCIYYVVCVGPGRLDTDTGERKPMHCREGERILMSPGALMLKLPNMGELFLTNDQDVLGIYKPTDQAIKADDGGYLTSVPAAGGM